MAVRITAGRIMIAAFLAVAMGVASFGLDRFDYSSTTAVVAPGEECVGGYRMFNHGFEEQDPESGSSESDWSLVPFGVTPIISGNWCYRSCEWYCEEEFSTQSERDLCGATCSGCHVELLSCSLMRSVEVPGGGRYFYLQDEPTYDNTSECVLMYPDPTCGSTGTSSSTDDTSSSSSDSSDVPPPTPSSSSSDDSQSSSSSSSSSSQETSMGGGGRVGFTPVIVVLPDGEFGCDPLACQNGGAIACGIDVCQPAPLLPCIQCVPPVGGLCTGRECQPGQVGSLAAAAAGMECSLLPNIPCFVLIPPNTCGNGRIDPLQPTTIDSGCRTAGASNQYCMPANQIPGDPGQFEPAHQCYVGAHCQNVNGQCTWESTPQLESCIQQYGGNREQEGRWQFRGQLIGRETPSPLLAQVGGAVEEECIRVGCSGEICVAADEAPIATSCELVPGAACYQGAACETQASGRCGWTETPTLTQCLSNNAGATGCWPGQPCLWRDSCAAEGGSAGNACGASPGGVCCSGIVGNNQPLEQCDDGNRANNDDCNNNCEINCQVDADCPEGACVANQCVAQCVIDNPIVPPQAQNGQGQAGNELHAAAPGNLFLRLMAQEPADQFELLP